jgi:VanZ family protein
MRPETFRNAGIAPAFSLGHRRPSDYAKNLLLYIFPGAVLMLALWPGPFRRVALGGVALHPVTVELAQSVVMGRTSSALDLLSAWAGLLLGIALATLRRLCQD